MIEERCNHMIVNIPLTSCNTNELETQQYTQNYDAKENRGNNLNNMTNISNMSPVPKWNANYSMAETTGNRTTMSNGTMSNTMIRQSLKSQSTKQLPLIKSVDNNEMDTVPK